MPSSCRRVLAFVLVAAAIAGGREARAANTVVHVASADFLAPVSKVFTAAPRIAVVQDTFQSIAYDYLNNAGILDSTGAAWSDASVDSLTPAEVAGTAQSHADGMLFRAP